MAFTLLHSCCSSLPDSFYRARVHWENVNRDQYNSHVEASLFRIFACQPLPTTAAAQVHYYAKALTHAFLLANKTLPQGHCRNPIPWCPPKLVQLLDERNHAWHLIVDSNVDLVDETLAWKHFEDLADKFRKEVNSIQ